MPLENVPASELLVDCLLDTQVLEAIHIKYMNLRQLDKEGSRVYCFLDVAGQFNKHFNFSLVLSGSRRDLLMQPL